MRRVIVGAVVLALSVVALAQPVRAFTSAELLAAPATYPTSVAASPKGGAFDRKVLVIYVPYDDVDPHDGVQNAADLAAMYFAAAPALSITGWFDENSNHIQNLSAVAESDATHGGAINDGVVTTPFPVSPPFPQTPLGDLVGTPIGAADLLVDFAQYDVRDENGNPGPDGIVGPLELAISVVRETVPGLGGPGDAQNLGTTTPSSYGAPTNDRGFNNQFVRLGMFPSLMTNRSTPMVHIHELMHQEFDGPGHSHPGTHYPFDGRDIMSSSPTNPAQWFLDSAWSRFHRGWLTPQIATVSGRYLLRPGEVVAILGPEHKYALVEARYANRPYENAVAPGPIVWLADEDQVYERSWRQLVVPDASGDFDLLNPSDLGPSTWEPPFQVRVEPSEPDGTQAVLIALSPRVGATFGIPSRLGRFANDPTPVSMRVINLTQTGHQYELIMSTRLGSTLADLGDSVIARSGSFTLAATQPRFLTLSLPPTNDYAGLPQRLWTYLSVDNNPTLSIEGSTESATIPFNLNTGPVEYLLPGNYDGFGDFSARTAPKPPAFDSFFGRPNAAGFHVFNRPVALSAGDFGGLSTSKDCQTVFDGQGARKQTSRLESVLDTSGYYHSPQFGFDPTVTGFVTHGGGMSMTTECPFSGPNVGPFGGQYRGPTLLTHAGNSALRYHADSSYFSHVDRVPSQASWLIDQWLRPKPSAVSALACKGGYFPKCQATKYDRAFTNVTHPMAPDRVTECSSDGCPDFVPLKWPGGRLDLAFGTNSPLLSIRLRDVTGDVVAAAHGQPANCFCGGELPSVSAVPAPLPAGSQQLSLTADLVPGFYALEIAGPATDWQMQSAAEQTDVDDDSILDNSDNCSGTPNPGQSDIDHDGSGDPCDGDPGPYQVGLSIQSEGGAPISEHGGVATPHVTLDRPNHTGAPIIVRVDASGSATSSSDYTLGSSEFRIEPGQQDSSTLLVPVDDALYENDGVAVPRGEVATLQARIVSSAAPAVVATGTASVVIADDDAVQPTTLVAEPVVVVGLKLKLNVTRFSARLTTASGAPIADAEIRFTAGASEVGRARTNAAGVATCLVPVLGVVQAIANLGYTASFDGTVSYGPSQSKGPLIVVG